MFQHSRHRVLLIALSISYRLDLNLRSSKNDDDNIVLNISVRFIEKCIVRNTRDNGEWGTEEREENLYDRKGYTLNPIVPGKMKINNFFGSFIYRSFQPQFDIVTISR